MSMTADKGADTRRKNNGKPTKDTNAQYTNESACYKIGNGASTRSPGGVDRDIMYGAHREGERHEY